MKKQLPKKPLTLAPETVRTLSDERVLSLVAGGASGRRARSCNLDSCVA
jgi:hypothetical protein